MSNYRVHVIRSMATYVKGTPQMGTVSRILPRNRQSNQQASHVFAAVTLLVRQTSGKQGSI